LPGSKAVLHKALQKGDPTLSKTILLWLVTLLSEAEQDRIETNVGTAAIRAWERILHGGAFDCALDSGRPDHATAAYINRCFIFIFIFILMS
jgi:hypothetical protein